MDNRLLYQLQQVLSRLRTPISLLDTDGNSLIPNEDIRFSLPALPQPPDVVLLDPTFPQRQKSALVKKKFQLLQRLEQPCENGAALFAAAVEANPKKIVVKRPVKGETLTEHKPDYSLTGKAIRYDCYVFAH